MFDLMDVDLNSNTNTDSGTTQIDPELMAIDSEDIEMCTSLEEGPNTRDSRIVSAGEAKQDPPPHE